MPTTIGRKTLFAVSATAISALGLLSGPAPAQAAPACGQYGFPGRVTVREDHGAGDFIDVTFNSTGTTVSGPATWYASKGDDSTGTITGAIAGDGAVDLTYMPPGEGGAVHFIGAVRESDMKALGTQGEEKWYTLLPLTCLGAATPNDGMAKVLGDVDMYDAPGGIGNKYPRFLDDEGGTATVKLITCQDDNWCNVVAPNIGPVWVWGEFIEH